MPHDYHMIIVNDAMSFVSVACSLSLGSRINQF